MAQHARQQGTTAFYVARHADGYGVEATYFDESHVYAWTNDADRVSSLSAVEFEMFFEPVPEPEPEPEPYGLGTVIHYDGLSNLGHVTYVKIGDDRWLADSVIGASQHVFVDADFPVDEHGFVLVHRA